jgi:DNA-binding transcriptional ArsR family regulator
VTLEELPHLSQKDRQKIVFDIIADANRRAILSLLVSFPQSVADIERQLRLSQPTVSKHLRVLREAGFVERTWMPSAVSTD